MTIGAAPARVDAYDKVVGAADYPGDRAPAGALVAKAVFTARPHARLVSLDAAAAEQMPGVVAVLTGADVPVNEYGLTMFDQPVFITVDHTGRSEVPCDVSRWEADHLALVVAETAEQADAAAAAIDATWDDLPVVADIDAALAPDAPLVHAHNGKPTNEYHTYKIRKGSMEAGWARAVAVVEATYELPHQEHAFLQPEAGVAYIDDDERVTVEVAGQWTHEDQEQIAHALDLPAEQVRVIYPAIGGAFGGREDMSLQIVLALAAWRLAERGERRPIAAHWSREESIVGHHKRHRGRIRAKWGADADGRIVAVESEAWLDAGAYNYTTNKVLGNCHLGQAGPYEVPNARIDSHAVYTTTVPGGAFRGFGGPQAAFVAESQMNKLAEQLGIDPVEIRRRNALRDGSIGITQTVMPAGVTLPEVIDRCASEAAFDQPLAPAEGFSPFATLAPASSELARGRGFACAFKNVGFSFGFPERCEARIVLHGADDADRPASAEVFHAGADVGQGAHTAIVQMAADATGVPFEHVHGRFSDTSSSGDAGSASASRLTFMSGNSILGAAEEAEKSWREGHRPAVGHFRFVPPPTEPLDPDTGECVPNFSYGYVAQAVELTVDRGTGHIVVDRVVSTHDVGRAINPQSVVGQVEGAVVQAHGYVLSERLLVEQGRVLNPRLSGYLIPGIGDAPERIDSVVLELADPRGPWGARGMAEMPYMTYAPAVIAALHDATGVWFDTFPLTPDRVLAALAP
ncbi:MAG: xanthine dehydrogenase family protein molybdopterin-binding subunit [Ilumatobacter sp.]|uniref:xanthine dehydrogenase family protein molybdopterin-binding subunit n=1 Tax=Ilumatobacter sp. TaxID=1967498 RepID=UPI0026303B60|nr:xanthine dehydrogenase family protein molybdopterin-binding subunit [Ilumatobacter sp.]MDJ0767507.1 xanthine dehydrogenase family protein molybdopterin-binding subunit [Ilumatobacter sp.]